MKHRHDRSLDSRKKAYTPPTLRTFGSVRSLTHSASSGSNENSMTGFAFMAASDRRLKDDIVEIGVHPAGFGLYLFNYKPAYRDQWGHGTQFGVMADEVEPITPEAVSVHPDGYKVVNYAMLGISRRMR